MVGLTGLLALRPCLDADGARQVGQIREALDRLLSLVDDLLDVARGETATASGPFSPAAILRELAAEAREAAVAKGLAFELEGEVDPHDRRLGDERRLRQILRILLSNAVKFTAEGGVALSVRLNGDRLEACVADTGPGLSPEIRARLLSPSPRPTTSIRRAHQGSGLGLALCKRLVEAMGGAVDAENRPGGGGRSSASSCPRPGSPSAPRPRRPRLRTARCACSGRSTTRSTARSPP